MAIEGFSVPDLQFVGGRKELADGTKAERDKEMRQKTRGQQAGEWAAVSTHSQPTSRYLQQLCAVVTPTVLTSIDNLLEEKMPNVTEAELKPEVKKILGTASSGELSVAMRLALLVVKRKRFLQAAPSDPKERRAFDYVQQVAPHIMATTLWPCIVARTDLIYVTIEDLLSVYEIAMCLLAGQAGLAVKGPDGVIRDASGKLVIGADGRPAMVPPGGKIDHEDGVVKDRDGNAVIGADGKQVRVDLIFAPGLKDLIRLHEKALDDYVHDFKDWLDELVIPETCVIDAIRGSALCSEGGAMIRLLERMKDGFEVQVHGKTARLSLLRAKSLFADGGRKEPTRFRRINSNIILEYDERRVVTELQLHHRAIRGWNEESHAHDDYEYFRGKLANKYEEEMDTMLERSLVFLTEASGIPVLLSMLVLLFADGNVSAESLPTSRLELYGLATEKVLQQRCAAEDEQQAMCDVLRRVAFANLCAKGQREFSSDDVRKQLLSEADRTLWKRLEQEPQGVPLIKVLAAPIDDRSPAYYQFRHLSFQEGLCAQMLASDAVSAWLSNSGHVRELLVYGLNVVKISGCDKLSPRLPALLDLTRSALSIAGGTEKLTAEAGGILGDLLLSAGAKHVQAVKIDSWLGELNVRQLCGDDPVKSIDCSSKGLGPASGAIIAKLIEGNTSLTSLDLSTRSVTDDLTRIVSNNLRAEGGKALAKALAFNTTLTSLDVSGGNVGKEGAIAIVKALEFNITVTHLNFRYNNLRDDGAKAIAKMLEGNATITSVNLSQNRFGVEGAKSIAAMLEVNTTVKTISLNWNNLGPEGGKAIAKMLEVNTTLTVLGLLGSDRLGANDLGPEGGKAIAESLIGNTTMETIYLGGNNLGPEGGKAMARMLEFNTTLAKVTLGSNSMGDDAKNTLREAVNGREGLQLYL